MLGLCDRFKCLPSQLDNESAEILKLLHIQHKGHPKKEEGGEEEEV